MVTPRGGPRIFQCGFSAEGETATPKGRGNDVLLVWGLGNSLGRLEVFMLPVTPCRRPITAVFTVLAGHVL